MAFAFTKTSRMARKFLVIAGISLFQFCAEAQNYVTLFEDCSYKGRSYFLQPGNYRRYQMKIGNDRLSSMQIPSGMKVTLYEHDDFKGKSMTFASHVFCLDASWNDQASSIVVESTYPPDYNPNDYITFYNDCYSRGFSRSLGPGTYSGVALGSLKQNISSFKFHGNLRLRVYTGNDNASGYHATFETDQSCLGGNYNDKIRSLVIEYRSGDYGGNDGYGGSQYATIYTDCSYRGNSLSLAPGNYRGDKLGLLKYNISSIKLPSNLRARVYVNNEYLSGSYYTLSESISCLSGTLNNRIGSLVIEEKGYSNDDGYGYPGAGQRVVIYTDADYRGQSASLLPGTYGSMAEIGFPDDALSSLTVPEGYRVVIYEYPNFRGKSYTITNSKSRFYISNWNDKTSSIAVYRDR